MTVRFGRPGEATELTRPTRKPVPYEKCRIAYAAERYGSDEIPTSLILRRVALMTAEMYKPTIVPKIKATPEKAAVRIRLDAIAATRLGGANCRSDI